MPNQTLFFNAYNLRRKARINTLLKNLKKKVKNFVVVDRQGQLIGEVRDLIIDTNRQLNFVVSKLVDQEINCFFRLGSKLIKQIDPKTQRVSINIDKSQIQNLPKYDVIHKEITGSEMAEKSTEHQIIKDNTTPYTSAEKDKNNQNNLVIAEDDALLQEDIIRLLGERIVVERSKRKVGEVIIRKEIETRMVQVPVRREKLIVEQVGTERRQLAEIDLGQEEISALDLKAGETQLTSFDSGLTVSGEFDSPKIASLLLNAIALERDHGCKKVRITIVVDDEERHKTYLEWFKRTSKG